MALASERSLDVVLLRIVELAVELTDARYGALGVLSPDGGSIEEFITVGITPEQRAALGDPPTGHGLLGTFDPRGAPPPDPGYLGGPSIGRVSPEPPADDVPPGRPGNGTGPRVRQHLPHRQAGRRGVRRGGRAGPGRPRHAGRYRGRERAPGGGDGAEGDASSQRLQVFEERERIGKELHDGVIQSLFALGMNLQAMATASDDQDLVRRLEAAVQDVDHAIRDLRNYIFGLRPGILADRQLDQALRELCSEFERTSAVVIVAEIDPAVAAELSPLAADVVQLARESLSNVGRHADAATCRVVLRRDGAAAILEVDDDGKGYDTSSTTGGMGLANLRNRVEAIGARSRRGPSRGTARPCRSGFRSERRPRHHSTMSAVTMPNMPSGPSTCGRMWQWNAQIPGSSARTTKSYRAPGATTSVSSM